MTVSVSACVCVCVGMRASVCVYVCFCVNKSTKYTYVAPTPGFCCGCANTEQSQDLALYIIFNYWEIRVSSFASALVRDM